jgi:hypothetical protein
MLIATVEHFAGQVATRHRVRDLSPGGIRIDNAAGLRPGATVLISVGALEAVGATIKWVREGFAGLAFAEQINPDEARKKAAIAPSATRSLKANVLGAPSAPSAGWVEDMRNPYRK